MAATGPRWATGAVHKSGSVQSRGSGGCIFPSWPDEREIGTPVRSGGRRSFPASNGRLQGRENHAGHGHGAEGSSQSVGLQARPPAETGCDVRVEGRTGRRLSAIGCMDEMIIVMAPVLVDGGACRP